MYACFPVKYKQIIPVLKTYVFGESDIYRNLWFFSTQFFFLQFKFKKKYCKLNGLMAKKSIHETPLKLHKDY